LPLEKERNIVEEEAFELKLGTFYCFEKYNPVPLVLLALLHLQNNILVMIVIILTRQEAFVNPETNSVRRNHHYITAYFKTPFAYSKTTVTCSKNSSRPFQKLNLISLV
jgi:hypothetical protein